MEQGLEDWSFSSLERRCLRGKFQSFDTRGIVIQMGILSILKETGGENKSV